jgi:hypothetical protein
MFRAQDVIILLYLFGREAPHHFISPLFRIRPGLTTQELQ